MSEILIDCFDSNFQAKFTSSYPSSEKILSDDCLIQRQRIHITNSDLGFFTFNSFNNEELTYSRERENALVNTYQ